MANTQSKDMAVLQSRILKKKNNNKGGGSKKYGRNLAKCALYKTNRSHKNKLVKLRRHLKAYPGDGCAIQALELAKATI